MLLTVMSRITPIYMGSTTTGAMTRTRVQDHPHIHGEHSWGCLYDGLQPGSPPYTWGAPPPGKLTMAKARITPIYMGSTRCSTVGSRLRQDHPHIHGEHGHEVTRVELSKGSPPYTWGALLNIKKSSLLNGITPIYMGSTGQCLFKPAPVGDHPHIHGEHDF